jgi:hypothetical protein
LKDPRYFTEVAAPFISNKLEKTFVDYWLLNNYNALETFLLPHSKLVLKLPFCLELAELNSLERVLMIHYLLMTDRKVIAKNHALSLSDKVVQPSQQALNQIYDQVLSMNKLSQGVSTAPGGKLSMFTSFRDGSAL